MSLEYGGMEVRIDNFNTKRLVPVRVHVDRGELRRNRLFAKPYVHKPSAYHNRIQKKWIKRFGVRAEYQTLCIENRILLMHQDVYDALLREQTEQRLVSR